jgi:GGDEF domain-containing protein
MFTRVRHQLIQRRFRGRTFVGRFRGELFAIVLFGYALPLVWVIGIAASYLRLPR